MIRIFLYLGEAIRFKKSSNETKRNRNNMILWYQLLKFLVIHTKNVKFLHEISKFIINGPTMFGALVTSVRQATPDTKFLEEVEKYFGSQWFFEGKLDNVTAHGFLVRDEAKCSKTLEKNKSIHKTKYTYFIDKIKL